MLKLKVPQNLKIKIAFITLTFDTTGTGVFQWVLLGITSFVLNALLWPYIVISSINAVFGTNLYWSNINVFIGTWLLLLTLSHFTNKD
jgi:hypothetical protein